MRPLYCPKMLNASDQNHQCMFWQDLTCTSELIPSWLLGTTSLRCQTYWNVCLGFGDCVTCAVAMLQVKSAEEFASRVNNSGGLCDLHIYEGAGHAFLNKPDSESLLTTCLMPDLISIFWGTLAFKAAD